MKISSTGKTLLIISLALGLISACSKQDDSSSSNTSMPTSAPTNDTASATSDAVQTAKPEVQEPQKQQSPTIPMSTDKPVVVSSKPVSPALAKAKLPANQEILALARKSGCLGCHSVEKKIVGPAWRDVSKRYKDVADAKNRLITKVAKGGGGNWKDVVGAAVMPPYSPRVSDDNIAQLVDFILSLEK